MADKKKDKPKGKSSAVNELKGFILILIVLWLIWFVTSGPAKSKNEKLFLNTSVENTSTKTTQ